MSRFLLITADSAFEHKVRLATAAGLPGETLAVKPELLTQPTDLLDLLSVQQPEVLVFGPGMALDSALRLAQIADVRFPNLSMVLVAPEDSGIALAAMRAGVRDVIEPTADIPSVRLLLERACQAFASRHRAEHTQSAAPAKQEHGLVIGVFSPKGGVGKTTIASNIAVGLGKMAPMGVVLVDLDLQFGDVASNLYLNPEYSVRDAVSSSASSDTMVLKAFLTPHPSGIYALCAPSNPADADSISADQLGALIKQLSAEFPYVVLDTGPGLTEHSLAALEQCTDAVWVTGMDVPSVRGLRSGLDVLGKLNLIPETRHVVLNFADSKTGLSVQDIEATLGAPVDVSIPRSRALSLATNRGVPLLQEEVRDPATKNLRGLVQRFNPEWRASSQRKSHRRVVIR
ncbi:pilus assembly protein CpaE [Arthrobacter sp. Soil782]|uniref:AAA family ATPase n=1 Tax=Arthrobacter sp. Soil782 TaxID=1736410 RepID=UPI0006FBD45E|nr:AAA family ATPase [Arthrobacter sp. Soil782]KRF08444.1 pilus assembly protein CpaE [Arthrobacter sp. Soil782]